MKGLLTRRSIALGAVAALAGASIDRLFATSQMRQGRAAALAAQDAAVRAQAHSDTAQTARSLRQALQDAAQDKAAAIAEVEAQLPSARDLSISTGFERLARTYDWLGGLRRSVGYFECYTNGVAYRGAAELIDHEGGLVLCGHEIVHGPHDHTDLFLTFFPDSQTAWRFPIRVDALDRTNDVAFAHLVGAQAQARLRSGALRPIRWPPAADPLAASHDKVVFVGFPQGVARLHATSGAVRGLRPVQTVNGDGSTTTHDCKIETEGVTFSGMSGGGVFENGVFLGIVNFSSPAGLTPYTYFTPATAIRSAHARLDETPASPAGRPDPAEAPAPAGLPAQCAFRQTGFARLSVD